MVVRVPGCVMAGLRAGAVPDPQSPILCDYKSQIPVVTGTCVAVPESKSPEWSPPQPMGEQHVTAYNGRGLPAHKGTAGTGRGSGGGVGEGVAGSKCAWLWGCGREGSLRGRMANWHCSTSQRTAKHGPRQGIINGGNSGGGGGGLSPSGLIIALVEVERRSAGD